MPEFKDLTGAVFGGLTAIRRAANRGKRTVWVCLCSCGKECEAQAEHLSRNARTSCGCVTKSTKHGRYKHPLYATWNLMLSRCLNTNHTYYHRYGGRGIKIFEPWKEFSVFVDYVSLTLGDRPKDCQMDRKDNDGDYCPGNVRWATRKENCRHKNNTRLVMYLGVEMSVAEASEKSGVNSATLFSRLRYGWSGEKLFKEAR